MKTREEINNDAAFIAMRWSKRINSILYKGDTEHRAYTIPSWEFGYVGVNLFTDLEECIKSFNNHFNTSVKIEDVERLLVLL